MGSCFTSGAGRPALTSGGRQDAAEATCASSSSIRLELWSACRARPRPAWPACPGGCCRRRCQRSDHPRHQLHARVHAELRVDALQVGVHGRDCEARSARRSARVEAPDTSNDTTSFSRLVSGVRSRRDCTSFKPLRRSSGVGSCGAVAEAASQRARSPTRQAQVMPSSFSEPSGKNRWIVPQHLSSRDATAATQRDRRRRRRRAVELALVLLPLQLDPERRGVRESRDQLARSHGIGPNRIAGD